MRKRITSFLLIMCIVITLVPKISMAEDEKYNIWLNGVQVTDGNKNDITGEGISGSISYDPGSKTLVLNDAIIDGTKSYILGDQYSTLYCNVSFSSTEVMTIELVGENIIKGPGTVPKNSADYAVYLNHSATFTGSGSLIAEGSTTNDNGSWSYGIYSPVWKLKISKGTTVTAIGGQGYESYGLYGQFVNVSGKLIAKGGLATSKSCGIFVSESLEVSDGEVNATGGNATNVAGHSYGIEGNVSISEGTVTAQTERDGDSACAFSNGAPSYDGLTSYTVEAGTNKDAAEVVSEPTNETYTTNKYVNIVASLPSMHTFSISQDPISIENGSSGETFKVINGDKIVDNILRETPIIISGSCYGGGLRILVDANNATEESPLKLVLNNVSIQATAIPFHITGSSCVDMTLIGENIFTPSSNAGSGAMLQLDYDAQLTISDKSTGSLLTTSFNRSGIGARLSNELGGKLIINGGSVTAKGRNGGAGISCKEVIINGGRVLAEGSIYSGNPYLAGAAIGYGGSTEQSSSVPSKVTITGGTVTAISNNGQPAIGGGNRGLGSAILTITPDDGQQIFVAAGENKENALEIEGSPFIDSTFFSSSSLSSQKQYFHSEEEEKDTIRLRITTHPTDQTVTEGEKATFNIEANSNNEISYQWQLDKNDGAGWKDLSGAIEASYTSDETTITMSGYKYRCRVYDGINNWISKFATLTVKPPEVIDTWTKKVKSKPSDGYIEEGYNITISSAEGLAWLVSLVNGLNGQVADNLQDKTVTLTKDIDLSGYGWIPIGREKQNEDPQEPLFAGIFNGNGKNITGMDVPTTNYAGLFGFSSGTVKNLTITEGKVSGGEYTSYAGGVVGNNKGKVENCQYSGSVTTKTLGNGHKYAGGIVGYNEGEIANCNNTGFISADDNISTHTYNNYAGGIAGLSTNDGKVINCSNRGDVITSNSQNINFSGGLVGQSSGAIVNCYNMGTVTAEGAKDKNNAGGIAGNSSGMIVNCYNMGNIIAKNGTYYNNAGGLVGTNSGKISNCYNMGDVSAEGANRNYAGGLVANNGQEIINCYWLYTAANNAFAVGSGSTTNCESFTEDEGRGIDETFNYKVTIDGIDNDETGTLSDALNAWVEIYDDQDNFYRWTHLSSSSFPVFLINYTLTFDNNDGTGITTLRTVIFGDSYGELPIATRTGYKFDGWFTDTEGGIQITSTNIVDSTADHTLYARWIANEYTVNFDANDGSVTPASKAVIFDGNYGELPLPTRTGYTFSGWYTEATGGTKITSTDKFNLIVDQTLYAHWTVNSYPVTFVNNDGTEETSERTVAFGDSYGELPILSREGYTFSGWYTEATGGTKITSTDTFNLIVDQTLYAHWTVNSYTVTFVNNDGTEETIERTVAFGDSYGGLPTPICEGYIFDGWYTEAIGGTKIISTTSMTRAEDHSLYAHWTANEYTVNFDANSGSVSTESKLVTFDKNYGELPTPIREGYSFDGWHTEATGGAKVTSITTVKLATNHILYAHWIANDYTVTFDANGGSVSTESKAVIFDGNYGELPLPTRTGYTFSGWFTEAIGGTKITSTDTFNLTADQTLYAHWNANEYTVNFDANGGDELTDTIDVVFDSPYGDLPETSREGYTFSGWYTEATGGIEVTSTSKVKSVTNHTLYAHWTVNSYTVTFVNNDGTEEISERIVAFGDSYGELPEPTRIGYEFDGWYTDDIGGIEIASDTIMAQIVDHTLYAHWTANEYTVNFDANGGSVSTESKLVNFGENYGELPEPTRTGYKFEGWYTAAEGGIQITSDTIVTQSTDHTLYTYWTELFSLTIEGPTSMILTEGYKGISTDIYTISGTPMPNVTKTFGNGKIIWNDETKKLDILEGLTEGAYTVILTASNGVEPDVLITFILTVEPESKYLQRTLEDSITGISISGNIHEGAMLKIGEVLLHLQGQCIACDAIRQIEKDDSYILFFYKDISLTEGFIGELTLTISVDEKYNGKTITILHCAKGILKSYTSIVKDGKVSFAVTELSPFAVFAKTDEILESTDPTTEETDLEPEKTDPTTEETDLEPEKIDSTIEETDSKSEKSNLPKKEETKKLLTTGESSINQGLGALFLSLGFALFLILKRRKKNQVV